MRDYLEIGPTPSDEDCAQVGSDDYRHRALLECDIFILQLRREFGDEPPGCNLRVKPSIHDFGTYFEVVCYYSSEEGLSYALRCEASNPNWDEESICELRSQSWQSHES